MPNWIMNVSKNSIIIQRQIKKNTWQKKINGIIERVGLYAARNVE